MQLLCLRMYRDPGGTRSQLENLLHPEGQRVGPMAARRLVGLLTAEDPLTPMDAFAK